jgi:hypothetical protein
MAVGEPAGHCNNNINPHKNHLKVEQSIFPTKIQIPKATLLI